MCFVVFLSASRTLIYYPVGMGLNLKGTKAIQGVNTFLVLKSQVVSICTTSFNVENIYVLSTQCICVFCMDLETNTCYFPIQH